MHTSLTRRSGAADSWRAIAALVSLLLASLLASAHAASGAWKWPTNVPVCWFNAVGGSEPLHAEEQRHMKLVKDAINDNYSRFSALTFSGWGNCAAGSADTSIQIRIMWTKKRKDAGPDGTPNPRSYVGREDILKCQRQSCDNGVVARPPGPGMSLDFDSGDSYTVSSALHEFGHALGFAHDHVQKGKADSVCKELHPEVTTHTARADDVFMAEQRGSQSVMSYCPIFGRFWRSITAEDVHGVQKHYGAGAGGPLAKAGEPRGSAAGCPEKYPAAGGFARAFLHVFDNTCWACPDGSNRTVDPNVGGNRACEAPARESQQPASDHGPGKGLLKTDCGRGQFLDVGKGRCYSCPGGYQRSLAPVTARNACVKTEAANFTAARKLGTPGCPAGAFADGTSGRCFSCGDNHDRTLDAVTAATACIRKDWGLGRRIFF